MTSIDRTGAFVIAQRDAAALQVLHERADALMIEDPRAWYLAVHELFERARASAIGYRIVDGVEVGRTWVDFLDRVERVSNQKVDALTPDGFRELVTKHLATLDDEALRVAITELTAGSEGGLWVITEGKMPPHLATEAGDEDEVDDDEVVDVAELTRKLRAVSGDDFPTIARVTVCELDTASIKDAAAAADDRGVIARARVRASVRIESTDPAVERAMRDVVDCAPRSRGRGIYDAAGARALVEWLKTDTSEAVRTWLLPAVKRAVAAKHGVAVVFDRTNVS